MIDYPSYAVAHRAKLYSVFFLNVGQHRAPTSLFATYMILCDFKVKTERR